MTESQNIEYKETWKDEYLKWVCGFANAQGGKIFIGINNKGEVTGVEGYKKLMNDLPNKAINYLGLVVNVNLHEKSGKHYIEIDVPVSVVPVSLHGIYHYRSGSTKQELKGNALNHFILKKMGMSWEQRPIPEASLEDIDEHAVQSFIKKALSKKRISESAAQADTLTILKNLKLINEDNELLLAALLLFGKEPDKYAHSTQFKIGRFGKSPGDLRFMADKVMDILDRLYLIRPISYKGWQRIEGLEYPEMALREAILNAIIHKDYSSTNIFLWVYDDQLVIWNPGILPSSLTIDLLKKRHSSVPRNKLIANVFFMAGYIEAWGRGIDIMMNGCKEYGIPEPIIVEEQGGISVTFLKDIVTEEFLQGQGLDDKQTKVILYIKKHGSITNVQYQALLGLSKSSASRGLQYLTEKKFIQKVGTTGKGTSYILNQDKYYKGSKGS